MTALQSRRLAAALVVASCVALLGIAVAAAPVVAGNPNATPPGQEKNASSAPPEPPRSEAPGATAAGPVSAPGTGGPGPVLLGAVALLALLIAVTWWFLVGRRRGEEEASETFERAAAPAASMPDQTRMDPLLAAMSHASGRRGIGPGAPLWVRRLDERIVVMPSRDDPVVADGEEFEPEPPLRRPA